MVPDDSLSRRQLLASGGAAGALLGGGALARRSLRTAAGAQTAVGGASGWPMAARDPGGTAYAPEADPPTDGINVRWHHTIRSTFEPIHSPTPVLADDVVYAVGPSETRGASGSAQLVAVSASDGDLLSGVRRPARTAPAVASGRAYRGRTVAALSAPMADPARLDGFPSAGGGSDGWFGGSEVDAWTDADEPRWTASPEAASDSYTSVHFGRSTTPPPVAVGDTLVTYFRGTLAAVDGSSGTVRWTSDEELTATRPAVRDGTAYVVGPEDGVRAYDLATGDHATVRERFPGSPMYLTATPDHLFVSGQSWIRALDADGEVDWEATFESEGEDVPAGPLAVGGGTVYARRPAPSSAGGGEPGTEPTARLCALDAADGSVRWVADGVDVESEAFLPAAADGLVAVPTADGALAGLDPADGSVRWLFGPGSTPCSPAAIVDDAVYVAENVNLYALEEA
ncbi:PQQ-binding-like beta-propeller repeat protein [Halosimplex pelagicum]|uniref:PQQ-binding-like beta-propeller repeat protein n=1 Tax=Halosimplex pelagicum TaxID=869886 RepID=A0A7D5P9L8_9EURY|nr:PQQ-binding-like beta-propeller repeat protein [Halosimplex pelagicum]QLH84177.1 PQQ-binding-like beta-propeller repeat protein [Halosimplex pelagicum]